MHCNICQNIPNPRALHSVDEGKEQIPLIKLVNLKYRCE
jgi:hypothetical protein